MKPWMLVLLFLLGLFLIGLSEDNAFQMKQTLMNVGAGCLLLALVGGILKL
jgi:hypothetical protein